MRIWAMQEISLLKDFEEAAKAAHESVEQAKKNALESLKKDLGEQK